MKTNKGQVLVLFLLLLPFILIFMAMIIDYGLLLVNKKNIESNIEEILNEATSNNITKEQIEFLLEKNITDINYKEVTIENKKITIRIKKKIKGGFLNIVKKELFNIDIEKTKDKKE